MANTADIQVRASNGRTTQELHRDALSKSNHGERGIKMDGWEQALGFKAVQLGHVLPIPCLMHAHTHQSKVQ